MSNLRFTNLYAKSNPDADTRTLILEAKEELQKFDDPWLAVSFQHKGLEVNVYPESDVDELVRFIELNNPEDKPPVLIHQSRSGHFLGDDYVLYTCNRYPN